MYVIDTHTWLWHLTNDDRLGENAKNVLDQADAGEKTVLVPTIVVVEAEYIAQKHDYDVEMQDVVDDLARSANYHTAPMTQRLLSRFVNDDRDLSIHDKIIVLTAETEAADIIAHDAAIADAAKTTVIW